MTSRRDAWRFIAAMGVVSLFADMTYEGARSIIGAYFYQLGAGAVLVGIIGGGAECLGYAVRWFAGRGADTGNRHWLFLYGGYALNLLVVPCLALTGSIGSAAALATAERLGKGVRNPPRDALLARAGERLGHCLVRPGPVAVAGEEEAQRAIRHARRIRRGGDLHQRELLRQERSRRQAQSEQDRRGRGPPSPRAPFAPGHCGRGMRVATGTIISSGLIPPCRNELR